MLLEWVDLQVALPHRMLERKCTSFMRGSFLLIIWILCLSHHVLAQDCPTHSTGAGNGALCTCDEDGGYSGELTYNEDTSQYQGSCASEKGSSHFLGVGAGIVVGVLLIVVTLIVCLLNAKTDKSRFVKLVMKFLANISNGMVFVQWDQCGRFLTVGCPWTTGRTCTARKGAAGVRGARLDVVCAVLHEYCVLRWRDRGFDISVSRFCDDEE